MPVDRTPADSDPAGPVIEARGVSKTFGSGSRRVDAVRQVSFRVDAGEVVALMGDNGAGKSTLLDLICGLTAPDKGELRVLGGLPRRAVAAGELAAVLQTGGLLPELKVAETIALTAALFGRPDATAEAMERAGISAIADRRIALCSGGERQRVKFAMALIPRARVLILDEPTAGMDWGTRLQFWQQMRTLATAGTSLLYATHHLDEVEGIADRVLVLGSGRLLADSTVAELRGAEATRTVRVRLGDGSLVDQLDRVEGVESVSTAGSELQLSVRADHCDEVALWLLSHGGTALRIEESSLLTGIRRLGSGEQR